MSGLDKVSVSVYPALYSLTLGAQSGREAYYVGYVWPRCPGMRLAWFRFREGGGGGSQRLALCQGPIKVMQS